MEIMSNYQDGFIVRDKNKPTRFYIDNEVFANEYVSYFGRQALVYFCLAKYANAKTQTCFPSYETIIKYTGIKNRNTIVEAIINLDYFKLIGVRRARNGKSNLYFLLHHSQWKELNADTRHNGRRVSKMGRKKYQKRLSISITGDTGNQRKNSTKEIWSKRRGGTEAMRHIGESLRQYKNTNP